MDQGRMVGEGEVFGDHKWGVVMEVEIGSLGLGLVCSFGYVLLRMRRTRRWRTNLKKKRRMNSRNSSSWGVVLVWDIMGGSVTRLSECSSVF